MNLVVSFDAQVKYLFKYVFHLYKSGNYETADPLIKRYRQNKYALVIRGL